MNRHPKRRRDPNQLAKSIIDIATGQGPATPPDNNDPAAVARGRMGGLKAARRGRTSCPPMNERLPGLAPLQVAG
jgi:hypothetical protein